MAGYLANLLVRLAVDPADLNAGLDKAERSVKKFSSEITSLGTSMSIGFSLPLLGLAAGAIKASADMESLKMALVATTGSSAEAAIQFERLKEVAKLPGLGFQEAVMGSVRLQQAGLSAGLAEKSLKAFGNALATIGGGKAELERVNYALGQIAGNSKVLGQDLNQLRNALPQIGKAMATAFDGAKTAEELTAMGVSGKQFVEGIIKEFEKLPPMTGGFKNSLENASDSLFVAAAAVGDSLKPLAAEFLNEFAVPMINKIKELADSFKLLPKPIQNAGLAVGGLAVGVPLATVAIGTMISNALVIATAWPKIIAVVGGLALALGTALTAALGGATLAFGSMGVAAGALALTLTTLVAKGVYDLVKAYQVLLDAQNLTAAAEAQRPEILKKLEASLRSHGVDITDLQEKYRTGKSTSEDYAHSLYNLAVAFARVKDAAAQATADIGAAAKTLGIKTTAELTKELEGARKAFDVLKKAGTENSTVLAAGADKVKDAYEALYGKVKKVEQAFVGPIDELASAIGASRIQAAEAAFGSLVEMIRKAQDVGKSLATEIKTVLSDPAADFEKWLKPIREMAPAFDGVKFALSTTLAPMKELAAAFEFFGLTSAQDLEGLAQKAEKNFEIIRTSGQASAIDIATAWVKSAQARADADLASGLITQEVYRQISESLKKTENDIKVASGETKEKVIKDRYDMGRELEQMSHRTFDNFERDLAKNLVHWGDWGKAIKDIGQNLAEDTLHIFLKGFFEPLEKEFAKASKKLGDLLAKALGGGSSSTPSVPGTGGGSTPGGGGGGGGAGGALGSLGSAINVVSGVVTAVSSVISNFQQYGMNKSLDLIVNHTLAAANDLANLRRDAWDRHTGHMLKLDDVWNSVRDVATAVRGGPLTNGKQALQVNVYLDSKVIWSGMATTAQLAGIS